MRRTAAFRVQNESFAASCACRGCSALLPAVSPHASSIRSADSPSQTPQAPEVPTTFSSSHWLQLSRSVPDARQNPSGLIPGPRASHDRSRADPAHPDRPRISARISWASRIGVGEPRPAAAVTGGEARGHAPAARGERPTVLDRVGAMLAGTGARRWCSFSQTPWCDGIATGSGAGGPDGPRADQLAAHRSVRRSALSSGRWQRPTRCGAPRGFMASCSCSGSTCQNARCRVSWTSIHVDRRRRGRRFSGITSRPRRRWISSRCQRSPGGFSSSSWSRHHRRRIVHVNITDHPTATWAAQQVVEAFPDDTAPRWLHRDRDRIYGEAFQRRVATAWASPRSSPRRRVPGKIRMLSA